MITKSIVAGRLSLMLLLLGALTCYAQERTPDLSESSLANVALAEPPAMPPTPADIVRNFIAAETKFHDALIHFSFKREAVLQTIGPQGEVTGEYIRNSVFVLDDRGQRIERVTYHPKATIKELTITKEDIQDLAGSQLFGLEFADLNTYELSYLGAESREGRQFYVIAARPRQEPNPNHMRSRFFVGRFWIDNRSFQPVYVEGITEPHGKQRFSHFSTERQVQIENLLFPSATKADDVLRFPHKDVHYRISVKYSDFKRFASRVQIVEIEDPQGL
ncbi:MAG: hypothetical protein QOK48_1782 [Blastocatellia bacterium]|jgi:hypothetical protein|nr:hypothetical protein [Blastocatellia bacterium]